jgi:hypothetical protein
MWFRKREPKPKYGDFRIIRRERRNGEVTFIVERYYIPFPRWDGSPQWKSPFHYMDGPDVTYHQTVEAAQAAIDAWVAKKRGEEVVSKQIIPVAAQDPRP